jgi:hypothetical protein
MILSKKQISEILKAKKLIEQANELLSKNLDKYDYDVIVAQSLSRSKSLNNSMGDLIDYTCTAGN